MATGAAENKTKSDDFRHTCGLCMEPYSRGRSPKLLPCFHTFCLPCLTALAGNVTSTTTREENRGRTEEETSDATADGETGKGDGHEETVVGVEEKLQEEEEEEKEENEDGEQGKGEETRGKGDDDEGKGEKASDPGDVFLCPTCRAPVTVPKGGAAALQTNFYLDVDDTEDPPSSGPVLCEMCEEGQQQEATHSCRDCQQRMCRSCRRLHDRVTGARDHRVEPITTQPRSQPANLHDAKGKKLCQSHPDQVLCFHCSKCDVSICLHCKLTSYEGHMTEDMATAAARAREELTTLLLTAEEQIQLTKTSLGRLGRDAKEVVRQKEEELREVNARCEIVLAWARRARDEFIEDLTSREQMALDGVQSEERSAGKVLDTLSSIVSQAGRPTLTDPDVVLLKNKLLAALLQDDALDYHRQLAARKNHRVFFASRASQALELNEVRAFIGELFDPQGVCKDPSPAVSFSELVAKVACLTTQVPKLERESKAIENRVSSTLADVQDKATYLEMQMEKRTAEVTDIQKQLQQLSQKVYFNVRLTSNRASPGYGKQVYFEDVISNEGSGFDVGNSVFKAPVSGLYVFVATVCSESKGLSETASVTVMVNKVQRAFASSSSMLTGSVSLVTKLSAGSVVYLISSGGTFRPSHTTFSGFLV